MLKRCQVLLTDWQVEYLKNTAERYDQSFSEVVRIFISHGFLYIIPLLHPEYKPKITGRQLAEMTRKAGNPDTSIEEQHQLVSKLYFEARKVVEYRLSKVAQEKKKQANGII
jgi:hypothetical protein